MFKNPILATLVALILAIAVNVFYFVTGNDLAIVVSRTLFADMLLVLSLVPIYLSILVGNSETKLSTPEKVKLGLKPVAMFTFFIALTTFVLFKLFGDPLVGARIFELTETLDKAVANGTINLEQKVKQLELAGQIYSPTSHVLIVLLANLFTGLLSSILAAVLIRK